MTINFYLRRLYPPMPVPVEFGDSDDITSFRSDVYLAALIEWRKVCEAIADSQKGKVNEV